MRFILAAAVVLITTAASAETPVERGDYLVNTIMTCGNCHTPMGPKGPDLSRPLSGGLSFDTPAFRVTAANITPDRETGIGSWTAAQLKHFLRTGERPNGVVVAPVMPTNFYGILSEADLDAIVAYLGTVKPVRNEVAAPIYNVAFTSQSAPFADKPMAPGDLADPLKRGKYLVTIGHCLECHTPMAGPAVDFRHALGKGGRSFPGPWGESVSANITSDRDAGLGGWSDDEIKRAITKGMARDGHALKPPMGFAYYARLKADDLDAIVAFLRTLPPLH
jgi:mono/diheme cytochrome c family protein